MKHSRLQEVLLSSRVPDIPILSSLHMFPTITFLCRPHSFAPHWTLDATTQIQNSRATIHYQDHTPAHRHNFDAPAAKCLGVPRIERGKHRGRRNEVYPVTPAHPKASAVQETRRTPEFTLATSARPPNKYPATCPARGDRRRPEW